MPSQLLRRYPAWLLARGARHDVRDRAGLTLAGAARRRLELLDRGDDAFAERLRARGMDIDALRDEGAQLAKLLGAVERAGGWSAFAARFPQRPRVRRAAPCCRRPKKRRRRPRRSRRPRRRP